MSSETLQVSEEKPDKCPHCGNDEYNNFWKCGFTDTEKQKFKCKSCEKTWVLHPAQSKGRPRKIYLTAKEDYASLQKTRILKDYKFQEVESISEVPCFLCAQSSRGCLSTLCEKLTSYLEGDLCQT